MAVYIKGTTECPLCNTLVDLDDEKNNIFLDHFIFNTMDPLYIFSGKVCHKDHFKQHPLHDAVLQRMVERAKHAEEEVCYISGTAVVIDNYKNSANLIFIDKLVNDLSHPLYEYNYRYLNKYYLPTWEKLDEFKSLINELKHSGKWGGNYLDQLLVSLDAPVQPAWDTRMIEIYKARFEADNQ